MKNHQTQEERHEMLVNGPIETVIPKLAIPTIISMMVSSIYNTADTFFVSQIGTSASGAVGVIFSAMAIIQALSFMIGMGSGNYMARTFGAGNQELGEKNCLDRIFYRIDPGYPDRNHWSQQYRRNRNASGFH